MIDYPEYPPFPVASLDHWLTTPPIEEGDPDEAQCPLCGRWVDYHELDDGPWCARCETAP